MVCISEWDNRCRRPGSRWFLFPASAVCVWCGVALPSCLSVRARRERCRKVVCLLMLFASARSFRFGGVELLFSRLLRALDSGARRAVRGGADGWLVRETLLSIAMQETAICFSPSICFLAWWVCLFQQPHLLSNNWGPEHAIQVAVRFVPFVQRSCLTFDSSHAVGHGWLPETRTWDGEKVQCLGKGARMFFFPCERSTSSLLLWGMAAGNIVSWQRNY